MPLNDNALAITHDVRNLLGITDLTQDLRIERLINAVSDAFVEIAGRSFHRATWVEDVVGYGDEILALRNTPLVSITSIQSIAEDGTLGTAEAASSYRISSAGAGFVYRSTGWAANARRVRGILDDRLPGSEVPNWRVTYVGGYVTQWQTSSVYPGGAVAATVTLPQSIEREVIAECVTLFRSQTERRDIIEDRLGDSSVKYRSDVVAVNQQPRIDLSPTTQAVAMRYRNGADW